MKEVNFSETIQAHKISSWILRQIQFSNYFASFELLPSREYFYQDRNEAYQIKNRITYRRNLWSRIYPLC